MRRIRKINYLEIDELSAEHPKLLVLITGKHCPFCVMLKNTVGSMSDSQLKNAEVVELDVSEPENKQYAYDNDIRSIPRLQLYYYGRLVYTLIGAVEKDELIARIKEFF
jgi:thiol-disulfide isomerase/thioredoxin